MRSRVGELKDHIPGGMATVASSWPSENEMALEVGAMGQTVSARLEVQDTLVRVHLVLPRREPFARDKQEAQASVVLTMAGAARLDREGTQAVLNLIAAAVPGLRLCAVANRRIGPATTFGAEWLPFGRAIGRPAAGAAGCVAGEARCLDQRLKLGGERGLVDAGQP